MVAHDNRLVSVHAGADDQSTVQWISVQIPCRRASGESNVPRKHRNTHWGEQRVVRQLLKLRENTMQSRGIWFAVCVQCAVASYRKHGYPTSGGFHLLHACYLGKDDRNWVIRLETTKETYLDIARQYFPASQKLYRELINETYPLVDVVKVMLDQMTSPEYYRECDAMSLDQRYERSENWFLNISRYVDLLKEVQTFTAHRVIADIAKVKFA